MHKRIVVIAFGSAGDVIPLLSVCMKLFETHCIETHNVAYWEEWEDASEVRRISIIFVTHSCFTTMLRTLFNIPLHPPINDDAAMLSLMTETAATKSNAAPQNPPLDTQDITPSPWGDTPSIHLPGCLINLSILPINSNPLRQTRSEAWSTYEADQVKSISASADCLVFNFFAIFAWHLAQFHQIPSVLVSPCPPPSTMPDGFWNSFCTEYGDVVDAFKTESNLTQEFKTDDAMQESDPPIRGSSWVENLRRTKCTRNDIEHWMWRLCLSDHGSFRRQYLQLSECIFEMLDGSPPHIPSPTPVVYLFSGWLVPTSNDWPISTTTAGFPSSPFHSRWWIGYRSSCMGSLNASDVRLSSSTDNSLYPVTSTLRSLLDGRSYVYVSFGTMHTKEFQLVPTRAVLIRILQPTAKTLNIKIVLHLPVDEFSNTYTGVPEIKEENSDVITISGFFDIHTTLKDTSCVATVTHGSAGSVGLILNIRKAHVVLPFFFDQLEWCNALESLNLAVKAHQLCEHLYGNSWDDLRVQAVAAELVNSILMAKELYERSSKTKDRTVQPSFNGDDVAAKVVWQCLTSANQNV